MPSLTQEMLQHAQAGGRFLGPRADRVRDFIHTQLTDEGGFRGRDARNDLYYTLFGLQCARALACVPDTARVAAYLARFHAGETLDLMHAACLARCWALNPDASAAGDRQAQLLRRIESFRARDGGYALLDAAQAGSVYGCFLAFLAYQDLGQRVPKPDGLIACIGGLQTADHAYANAHDLPVGTTPATAAAIVLLRELAGAADDAAVAWLLARHDAGGGFIATPGAPVPDLLSTATALFALTRSGSALDTLRAPCRLFVESVLDERDGFRGTWIDDVLDCEYTFYGLLALGCLAPATP